MTSAIIDIQCVVGANSKYFIKEMSVLDINIWSTQHWIFKHSSSIQDDKSLMTNKWLERHYHKIPLEFGDVEFKEISKILNLLIFQEIYVKGEQKQIILKEYLPNVTITNLEDIGCPRLEQLCIEDTLPRCIYHSNLNPKQCTFYKVFMLKKWFINNS